MATAETPAVEQATRQPDEWPDVLRLDTWIVQQAPNEWYAIVEDFNVAGTGRTANAALAETMELTADYVNACVRDGMSYLEALRPLPFRDRVKLHALALLNKPRKWLSQEPRAEEGKYLFPTGPNGHHAVC
jgi:hypothetical protein